MLTKEFHFNYNHLEREAWFYKILVISYGIQANIILLKSGVDGPAEVGGTRFIPLAGTLQKN